MLIKDIEAIEEAGVNFLKKDDTTDIIDEIVELPLRRACKMFKQKGIETIMSSANKNNLVKEGEKVIEKEDIYDSKDFHTFLDAGKGYAWLMINFDSLSDENKALSFQLEKRFGPKIIWFVHPFNMDGNIEFSLKIGKYDYDFLKEALDEDDIPQNVKIDEKLIEFEKRHLVLMYPWADSSTEALFLRMPINEKTTVEEVDEYFVNFAKCFNNQIINKKVEEEEKNSHKVLH